MGYFETKRYANLPNTDLSISYPLDSSSTITGDLVTILSIDLLKSSVTRINIAELLDLLFS